MNVTRRVVRGNAVDTSIAMRPGLVKRWTWKGMRLASPIPMVRTASKSPAPRTDITFGRANAWSSMTVGSPPSRVRLSTLDLDPDHRPPRYRDPLAGEVADQLGHEGHRGAGRLARVELEDEPVEARVVRRADVDERGDGRCGARHRRDRASPDGTAGNSKQERHSPDGRQDTTGKRITGPHHSPLNPGAEPADGFVEDPRTPSIIADRPHHEKPRRSRLPDPPSGSATPCERPCRNPATHGGTGWDPPSPARRVGHRPTSGGMHRWPR